VAIFAQRYRAKDGIVCDADGRWDDGVGGCTTGRRSWSIENDSRAISAGGSATEAIGILREVECCKTIERQRRRRAVGDRGGGGSL
jgi:hypothetical protein